MRHFIRFAVSRRLSNRALSVVSTEGCRPERRDFLSTISRLAWRDGLPTPCRRELHLPPSRASPVARVLSNIDLHIEEAYNDDEEQKAQWEI
jgi:hypothetical protein